MEARVVMNKKEAIAYAQVTLAYMQSTSYISEINPVTFGIEMKQCFKTYPRNLILNIASSQILARKQLKEIKNGSDIDE